MANPRKFSEKIALQKQKEAEGTAEFEKIMKEVTDAKGVSNVEDNRQSLSNTCINISGSGCTISYRESRGRSVGVGPIRRTSERKVDTSPYGGTYLCLPNTDFRRVKSDPAIHNSLAFIHDESTDRSRSNCVENNMNPNNQPTSPNSPCQMKVSNIPNQNFQGVHSQKNSSYNVRQSSNNLMANTLFCDNQLSVSMANTASLPDLTSLNFVPKNCPNKVTNDTIPIGMERENEMNENILSNNSVYINQEIPTGIMSPHSINQNRNQYSPNFNFNSRLYSPTQFISQPGQMNNISVNENNMNKCVQFGVQPDTTSSTNHVSFANISEIMQNQEHQNIILQPNKSFSTSINSGLSGSQNQISYGISNFRTGSISNIEYRNPQSRPSPGSSPGYVRTSNFPGCESNPNSPLGSDSPHESKYVHSNTDPLSPSHSFLNQTNNDANNFNQQMQNHFQQFSLVDSNSTEIRNVNETQQTQSVFQTLESNEFQKHNANLGNNESSNKNRIHSSNLNSPENQCDKKFESDYSGSLPPQQTRIPEIVFTDFSSSNTDFTREIFESLDLELSPLDVEGLQMISDNSTMTDQMTEDKFREELN